MTDRRPSSAARHDHAHRATEEDETTDDAHALDPATVDPVDPDVGGDGVGGEDDDDSSLSHGSNVRVIVRIRPLLDSELAADHRCTLLNIGGDRVRMDAPQPFPPASSIAVQSKENLHRFAFDAVLGPQASQTQLFRAGGVDHMLEQLMKGYHATICQ